MLDKRAQILLKTLIERYIAEGQPIGSRTLSKYSGLDLSPATIRNAMSDLEVMGLIASPHTSAGRRVGARYKAHHLEIGHRVADRGGRKIEPGILRQRARADRLAFGNVALDQGLEQDLGALVEHGSLYTRAHGSRRNAGGTSAEIPAHCPHRQAAQRRHSVIAA